jgi:lipopolysaccharide export system protein LptA
MPASIRNNLAGLAAVALLALGANARAAELLRPGDALNADADVVTSDFRTNTLEFSGNVRVEADLQSDSANAAVVGGQLARARAEGSPAQFQQRGGSGDRQIRGRAGVIEYDFAAGIVKLTDQVWFSNGKDEFRGDVVIYNVRDERLQINPGGQGRVQGIIRPQGKTTVSPPAPAPESGA